MTALVTYIYPNSIKYFDDFHSTILNQSNRDFEVIFFNDGIENDFFKKIKFQHKVIDIDGSPLEIRFKSFNILKNLEYDKFIFLDSDDTMSSNRIEILKRKLDSSYIVCNDLNLMNENNIIYQNSIWKNRLHEGFSFGYTFLKDKNIVGFGNTAFRRELLKTEIVFNKNPLVADWFVFYQLLKKSKKACVFTSECQTNYRQHENNDAGIKEISEERLSFVVKVTNQQYKALNEIGIENFELTNSKFRKSSLNLENNFPFWWEEITINNEKD